MKLKVKRYNTRRPEPLPDPVAAQPVPSRPMQRPMPTPVTPMGDFRQVESDRPAPAPSSMGADEALFAQAEDGFGAIPFPTAAVSTQGAANAVSSPSEAASATDLDAIRREGLTGRQLRLARRMAQKYGLPATSDFDAVRLLRQAGLDPFRANPVVEIVAEDAEGDAGQPPQRAGSMMPVPAGARLPQTIKPVKMPAQGEEVNHAAEILKMQQDLARRRRRRSMLMMARLFFFVILPTFLAGFYYYRIATPLYATKTEFVIQQAMPQQASGSSLGGLASTPMANMQDSITVQGYLQSRDAMLRLDQDIGFRNVFAAPDIDPIQRLAPDATNEAAYKIYQRNVRVSYDPTEGIIRMEVIAPDPEVSVRFADALIGYAEEQVDQLTQRLREDAMKGARESYTEAETALLEARQRAVTLQETFKVLSSEVEVSLITGQIGQLEGQLTADRLSLAQMESNATPNQARMEPLKRRIATLESEIALLRSKLVEEDSSGQSLARVQSELAIAQADADTRQMMLSQSLQSMETARIEANRQARYISLSVAPVAPDEATYPRAFENTMVAMMIFAGIYLILSMTAAILREQVSA
ncbi:MAG: capsule biosynthesis protein [Rhodobacteraceae bacterium]|nr:capsule biosynthesis protein [Paracoccaceae bacterium]